MTALPFLRKLRQPATLLLMSFAAMVAACQTTQTAAIDLRVLCGSDGWLIVRYSSRDTIETQEQVVVLNARRDAFCGVIR